MRWQEDEAYELEHAPDSQSLTDTSRRPLLLPVSEGARTSED